MLRQEVLFRGMVGVENLQAKRAEEEDKGIGERAPDIWESEN